MIGGNLEIKKGTFFITSKKVQVSEDEFVEFDQLNLLPSISAPSGQINLVSVASKGEVKWGDNFVDVSSFAQLADIEITNSLIQSNTTNADGIGINVRAARLTLNDGRLVAHTFGEGNGGNINIQVNGTVELSGKVDDPSITDELKELISTHTYGEGDGGNVDLKARQLHITNARQIASVVMADMESGLVGKGQGGDIRLTISDNMTISDVGGIGAITVLGDGDAGDVRLEAENATVTLKKGSVITSSTFFGTGNGGDIILKARQLNLSNGSQVQSGTSGQGNGGNIHVKTENIIISERNQQGRSGIFASSESLNKNYPKNKLGNAGDIVIETNNLSMSDNGTIAASTFGPGQGGDLTINVKNHLSLTNRSSILARSLTTRPAPDASLCDLTEENTSNNSDLTYGDAGTVAFDIGTSLQMNCSCIRTTADNSGGGKISVTSPGYLYLTDSEISSSVQIGGKDGGDITLNPKLFVLENSTIKATAHQGNGGNIDIVTVGIYGIDNEGNYLYPKDFLDASSEFGINGEITISSPENVNIEKLVLPTPPKIKDLPTDRCAGLTRDDLSRFTIVIRDVFPESPLDLKTHYLFDLD